MRVKKQLSNKNGQSLFEVLIALTVMVLVIVAIVSLSTTSIRNTDYSKNKSSANQYAQEAVEWLRQRRDEDWDTFFSQAESGAGRIWCLSSNLETPDWPAGAGSCQVDNSSDYISDTIFLREITLTQTESNIVDADVRVEWNDGRGNHLVSLMTVFTDW